MTSDKLRCLESCLREKFTKEVVTEVLEQERINVEKERTEREGIQRTEEESYRNFLSEMHNKHPLYDTQGASLYWERSGQRGLQPFRKRTAFSKPIHEQYGDKFKPE